MYLPLNDLAIALQFQHIHDFTSHLFASRVMQTSLSYRTRPEKETFAGQKPPGQETCFIRVD